MKTVMMSMILAVATGLPAAPAFAQLGDSLFYRDLEQACAAGGYPTREDCIQLGGAIIRAMTSIRNKTDLDMWLARIQYQPLAYQDGLIRLTTSQATCTFRMRGIGDGPARCTRGARRNR